MTVTPLEPDLPIAPSVTDAPPAAASGAASFGAVLQGALGAASGALDRADHAERAFAAGRGGLQEMIVERAQADVMLSIASSAASRTAQAVSTILGMQI
ncbi:MAG TPA: flagellar hook-basal body complex protein FliE [Candidatus Baltobacteraceae bacterium]